MKFIITREILLPGLQTVCSAVERRQTLPILSNLLLCIEKDLLSLTTTDMEVELMVEITQSFNEKGEITLPARKLLDICRTLPEGSELRFEIKEKEDDTKENKLHIRSGHSRFTLVTMPAREFPLTDMSKEVSRFYISQKKFRALLQNTQFAMAQQDVRYYLNGLLLEIEKNTLRAVATDGHRLALDETEIEEGPDLKEPRQIIIPRKGISELTRLLQDKDERIEINISSNHVRMIIDKLKFTSKLIDGRFPDYQRVMPSEEKGFIVIADREKLKQSLTRASILSNEKYRGIRINLKNSCLRADARNPEQEEAEEELEVVYTGDELEIGFNVAYLLDILGIIKTEKVRIKVQDSSNSCLILPDNGYNCKFVVMPMRL